MNAEPPFRRISRDFARAIAVAVLIAAQGCDRDEPEAAPSPVTLLAAASTKEAIEEIAADYESEAGATVDVSLGASNALAQQILAGAPADLFLSASEVWADAVEKEGLVAQRVDLLTNRLVLVVPRGNPAGVKTPEDLLKAEVAHLAIAAENVPAGTYAEQALTKLDLFQKLVEGDKLARGHDVRATLAFVERGEAEAGIVYSTDALAASDVERVYEFDPATHDRIVYPLVLLKAGAGNLHARGLFQQLKSRGALEVFRRHGFESLVDEGTAVETSDGARRP